MLERLTDTDKKALIDLKAFDGFKGYTP